MKKKTLILIFIILYCSAAFAQTYTLYGDKTFGSDRHEHTASIIDLNNGNLLLATYSFGKVSGDKTAPSCDSTILPVDIWLLKIDTAFNILWDKCYGGSRPEYQPYLLKTKNPDRFILTSASSSDSSCQKTANNKGYPTSNSYDFWNLTIDSGGNPINDYTWGGTSEDRYPKTIELNSGNFVTCGASESPVSGDKTVANYVDSIGTMHEDYWIVKTDSLGNKLWDKVFGGIGREYYKLGTYENMFNILPDKNDDFILAGTTDSPLSGDISDSSKGLQDIWIIKIDSAGNKIWDKRYGGSGNEQCNYIMHTADSGYLACGSTASPQGGDVSDSTKGQIDCWVIKIDSMGNKQWDKRYGGNKIDAATWIEKAPGGGYWISGVSASDSSGDVSEARYAPINATDYWIFKIDEAGNKLWDRRFGGPGMNIGSTFTLMPDGSIFLFGGSFPGTSPVKTDSGGGQEDIWIVHFKYIDSLTTSGIYNQNYFNTNLSVFPNPTTDVVTVTSSTENIKEVGLINLLGETMLEQKVNNARTTQLNLQPYPPGFYFVKVTGADYTVVKKVLRQ
jgi:hypothetical protein